MDRAKLSSERGAILIYVAVSSLVLIAFTMFVVDYGILWVSRHQAQNAADSGALAGAVALAFDDYQDRSATGPAKVAGHTFALTNDVWGEDVSNNVNTDVLFYSEDSTRFPDDCAGDDCVRVDVYRNQARGNALPMWFGQLVGVTQQGVRATAIARAAAGNATDCLKPWAVIDKWAEHYPVNPAPWTTNATFDKYLTKGPSAGLPDPKISPPDEYIAPSATYDSDGHIVTYSPGTGFHPYTYPGHTYTSDYGQLLQLKAGDNKDFQFGSGWFMALALADSRGGKDYENNIKHCIGVTYKIGDPLEVSTEPGDKVGPTRHAVADDADSIVKQDPGAYWDPSLNDGHGGVAGSAFAVSPRIVAIPLVNPDLVAEANRGGRTTVPIANIAGFFVKGLTADKKGVEGYLMTMPGLLTVGSGGALPSSFVTTITLVR